MRGRPRRLPHRPAARIPGRVSAHRHRRGATGDAQHRAEHNRLDQPARPADHDRDDAADDVAALARLLFDGTSGSVSYNIDPGMRTFCALVGLQDSSAGCSVAFDVKVDGTSAQGERGGRPDGGADRQRRRRFPADRGR
ncbi:hypothetical protein ACFQ0O_40865 [Saccharopolyspora spinosporotrichia]|uniref:hypothetical protein n=1 Tax=Saccharopolyspora erythraea TaxID=1836 RepID=UPI00031ECA17|nr:hypothetical protein [Saccharopolyspora erythraea]QRK90484.1 hypothetical protein JQX30_02970 [Saccharopolyspora erythraea]